MVISHAQLRLVLASSCVLLFAASLLAGQQPWPKVTEVCGDSSNDLLKRNGKVIWFSPKQMNAMATNRVTPPFPPMCRCQGPVIVAIIVNSDGNVVCAHVVSGHPLMSAASTNAATKWTFKPLVKHGDKVSFAGL